MKISKEQAAVDELNDAISLYKAGRYLSAITLAGASEEILAQLIKLQADENQQYYFTAEKLDAGLFEFYKDLLGITNYHRYRHKLRNELKHHGGKTNKNVLQADFTSVALVHISGAITNYRLLKGHFPEDQDIRDFRLEYGIG